MKIKGDNPETGNTISVEVQLTLSRQTINKTYQEKFSSAFGIKKFYLQKNA